MIIDSDTAEPERDGKEFAPFIAAVEEYHQTGTSSLRCDRCKALVHFENVSPQCIVHSCECVKINGTLKGL